MSAPLKVLIACEFTGTVRREFDKLGHDVWSCDLRRAEDGSNRHIIGDAREVVQWGWDLLIVAHPPCTRLCNSGVRWIDDPSKMKNLGEDFTDEERTAWLSMDLDAKRALMQVKLTAGAALFSDLWNAPVKRVAVENPVMHKHAKARIENYQEFTQSIQPWQFGDWERKRTCLWLRGLPALRGLYATEEEAARALGVSGRPDNRVHSMSPGEDRSKERSIFPIDRTRHGRTMGRLRTRNGKDRGVRTLFDLANPGAEVIRAPFGGGWIVPLTPEASQALMEFFDEEPGEIAPLGGRIGYIVEPYQAGVLAEHLRAAGIAWKVN